MLTKDTLWVAINQRISAERTSSFAEFPMAASGGHTYTYTCLIHLSCNYIGSMGNTFSPYSVRCTWKAKPLQRRLWDSLRRSITAPDVWARELQNRRPRAGVATLWTLSSSLHDTMCCVLRPSLRFIPTTKASPMVSIYTRHPTSASGSFTHNSISCF